ncbi:MAG: sulfotransferase, partial [Gammaproteobacteria bacterium]|nr:sulfotransferase [Gammaproteobacteria bacterium]
ENDAALLHLGLIYDAFSQWHQAAQYLRQAVALKPSNSLAQKKLAEMLLLIGDTDAALMHAKKALSLDPEDSDPIHLIAIIHKTQGDMNTAIRFFEKCIEINPINGAAYGELVRSKKITTGDYGLIKRMEAQLAKGMPAASRSQFQFALAKAYDDLKEYDKAFNNLHQGNLLLQGQFSLSKFKRDVSKTKKAYKSVSIAQLRDSGNPSDAPIFVVGMPRSGTTLIDQVLSSHSLVHSLGESHEIELGGHDACKEAGLEYKPYTLPKISPDLVIKYAQRYLDRANADAPAARRIIDKMPANFFKIGHILTLFPNAKIIHSKRHPLDTGLSCYFQRFTASIHLEWSNDMAMLGEYYRGYADIMEFWKQRFPAQILDVQYEDLVNDLEKNVHRIIAFVGLEWEDACLNFHQSKRIVQTASLWQVRQPLYTSSVCRWKPYAKHLGPLVDSLGDILTETDYQALREAGLNKKRPSGWIRRLLSKH